MEISLISSEEKVLQKFPGIFARKPLSLGVRRSAIELGTLKSCEIKKEMHEKQYSLMVNSLGVRAALAWVQTLSQSVLCVSVFLICKMGKTYIRVL